MAKDVKKSKDKNYLSGYEIDDGKVTSSTIGCGTKGFLGSFPKTPKLEPKRKENNTPSRQPVSKSVFYADCTSDFSNGPMSSSENPETISSVIMGESGHVHLQKSSSPLPISNTKVSQNAGTNRLGGSSSYSDDAKSNLMGCAKYNERKIANTNSLPRERSRTPGFKLDHSNILSANSTSQPQLSSTYLWKSSDMASHTNGFLRDSALTNSFEVGDRVLISIDDSDYKGVVRWQGELPDVDNPNDQVLGLEMDRSTPYFNDGCFKGKPYFECPPHTGIFMYAKACYPAYGDFGAVKCPVVNGKVSPKEYEDIVKLCGQNKGIQGHYNSCYLDATLFSMFAFTTVFDQLLFREPHEGDIKHYRTVQEVLRDKVVNPLRKNMYVRADRVMELRELLDGLSSVSGLTCEEKDPEEFLNSLLQQILKAEPFLKLSSGQESNYYQLFVEKDEKIQLPTVQHLLEQSLHSSSVKLKEAPSCLIILMPRFGKTFKVYPRIFPSLLLDVTDIIENLPRKCSVCGQRYAVFECLDCFQESADPLNRLCAMCESCYNTTHSHEARSHHKSTKLNLPSTFKDMETVTSQPQEFMELFAVVCIETSHYVSFVKCGTSTQAPWCFFDSMADRKGEQDGYNIPEITPCPDLQQWLTDDGYEDLKKYYLEGGLPQSKPPNYVKRLLNDVYLCMYINPGVAMYK